MAVRILEKDQNIAAPDITVDGDAAGRIQAGVFRRKDDIDIGSLNIADGKVLTLDVKIGKEGTLAGHVRKVFSRGVARDHIVCEGGEVLGLHFIHALFHGDLTLENIGNGIDVLQDHDQIRIELRDTGGIIEDADLGIGIHSDAAGAILIEVAGQSVVSALHVAVADLAGQVTTVELVILCPIGTVAVKVDFNTTEGSERNSGIQGNQVITGTAVDIDGSLGKYPGTGRCGRCFGQLGGRLIDRVDRHLERDSRDAVQLHSAFKSDLVRTVTGIDRHAVGREVDPEFDGRRLGAVSSRLLRDNDLGTVDDLDRNIIVTRSRGDLDLGPGILIVNDIACAVLDSIGRFVDAGCDAVLKTGLDGISQEVTVVGEILRSSDAGIEFNGSALFDLQLHSVVTCAGIDGDAVRNIRQVDLDVITEGRTVIGEALGILHPDLIALKSLGHGNSGLRGGFVAGRCHLAVRLLLLLHIKVDARQKQFHAVDSDAALQLDTAGRAGVHDQLTVFFGDLAGLIRSEGISRDDIQDKVIRIGSVRCVGLIRRHDDATEISAVVHHDGDAVGRCFFARSDRGVDGLLDRVTGSVVAIDCRFVSHNICRALRDLVVLGSLLFFSLGSGRGPAGSSTGSSAGALA